MKLFRTCSILALLSYAAVTSFAAGQASLSALDVPYNQDFNTLATAGTTNSGTPAGWEFSEAGTNGNSTYAAGDGGSNTGNTYSFGTGTSSERAFGGLQSGSNTPTIGGVFVNHTGQTITSLDVSYTGEQWRLGTSGRTVPDRLDFQYSLNASAVNTGTWVDVDALDFVAPTTTGSTGALDGNAAANRLVVTGTIPSLSVPPGGTVVLRWASFDASGADDGLAVDDFSITPRGGGVVLPSLTIDDVSVMEGDSGTMTATFTVTASTAVHTGISFDIATADGTATLADLDYVARQEAGQQIAAGTTTYAFEVTVNGDTTVEAAETFFVHLSGASGATIADGQGIGTITNDDVAPPVVSDVVISQVYGGGGNTNAPWRNDFIELFNAGATSVSLTNWSVQHSAATSATWFVMPLGGTIAPGGYYLIQLAAGTFNPGAPPLPAPDATANRDMAAGGGKLALVPSTTALAGACPVSGFVDFVGYGNANCFEGAAVAPAPSNTTADFRKRGGCYDSDNNNVDFSINTPAPRNSATPARSCTPVTAAIHDIQGNGLTTPFLDQDVITTGIVTGKKSNGFFMQAPPAGYDADPMTSEAVFVFTGATPTFVAGDEVTVRGTAAEFFSLTQVESSLPGDLTLVSQGNALPAPVTLTAAMLDPSGSPQQLEPYEGMRLAAAALVSVAPTDDFGEIATVLPGVPRPMREPGIPMTDPVPPDPTSGVPDCCIPRFDGNPERISIDTEGLVGTSVISVTSNVTLGNVLGPLDFSFGAYKVLPEVPPTVGANMTGVPVPAPLAGEFTVAGFNIENFAGDATRRQKAARAIRELMRSPDVIGHIEILDKPTLQLLADQVNNDAMAAGEPNPGYQAELVVATTAAGQPSTQNVGFLVKTSRVTIDSVVAEPPGTYMAPVAPPGNTTPQLLHDRPPLVLRATVDASGANPRPVIVVVNHLRSFIDIDLVGIDGDRVRAKRTAQAEDTARLLQELQEENPGVAVISVGDYNAYEFNDGYTDPMSIITGSPTPDDQIVVDASPDLVEPNYVNLTGGLPAGERYSFIFEGTPQALDHVVVNTVANSYLQRYAIARGNADFPGSPEFTADPARPEGASDHDMPVAYFRFPPPSADLAVSIVADTATAAAGGSVTYTVTVTNHGGSPAQNVVVSANAATTTYAFMAAGAVETFTFTAAIGCAVPNATLFAMTASVASETADPVAVNNSAGASVVVTNAAPTLSGITTSTTTLWPANHKMVDVMVGYTAADQCGPVVTGLSVTSNEPINGAGDGNTAPDWEVVSANLVRLRAERAGGGSGRIYTVTITATDAAGQATQSSVTITVPHSRK